MLKILKFFIPPDHWRVPVIVVLGIFIGLAAFSIYISKAPSYISNDPKVCVNCHIMSPEYSTWSHSSHRMYTTCNDCHVPHNNVFNKYYFKAKDGLRHATLFTLRAEPQVIRIKDAGANAVQKNCIRCHEKLITDVKVNQISETFQMFRNDRKCWECHRLTPHDRVRGLSTTPFSRVPLLESPVPNWIKSIIGEETKK